MTIEAAVYSRLSAVAGVTALVGTRIYPVQAPQTATKPYIVFRVVNESHEHHMAGAAGLAAPRVQLDIYATTSLAAAQAGEAVRLALQGWRGVAGGVQVRNSHLENRLTFADSQSDGTDVPSFRVTMDFLMTHAESVPTF